MCAGTRHHIIFTMNEVTHLVEKPFSQHTLDEKLQIKQLGPPKPIISCCASSSDRGRSYQRHVKVDWNEKCEWLCGSTEKEAVFCFSCLLFGGERRWTQTGFNDWKHLSSRTKLHEQSRAHLTAAYLFATFGNNNIAQVLDEGFRLSTKAHNHKVRANRHILARIIDCIKFCGAFELALRGHDETRDSKNPGIFIGLVDFTASLDAAMQDHLSSATVFKGTSKTIQNELLDCMYSV